MAISFKVENVPISAIRDRAMFNSFAGNRSYVIKDIGDELAVTYSASSFQVSLGSGEAVICGGSMTCEGNDDSLILEANEQGYIVIRVDLSQTGTNVCRLVRVSSLVQENINNGTDMVYDLPLYEYSTNGSGVSSMTDVRDIGTGANDNLKVLVITSTSFSSLPQTIHNSKIKENHVVVNSVLSNQSAQTSDWDILTNDGSLTISGSINGTTTLTLYLAEKQ